MNKTTTNLKLKLPRLLAFGSMFLLFLLMSYSSIAQTASPSTTITSSGGKDVCSGESFTLTDSDSKSYTSVSWDIGTTKDGQVVSSSGTNVRTVKYEKSGTYTITVTKTDSRGSKTTETISVTVKDCCNFDAVINSTTASICAGDYLAVSAADQGAGIAYTWNFGGGSAATTSGPGTHYVVYNSPGTYTITLTVNEDCKCNSCADEVATRTVIVKAKPSVSISGPSGCLYEGTDYTFNASATSGASITWSPSGTGTSKIYNWGTEGDKVVCATAELDGCTDQSCETVSVIDNTCPSASFSIPSEICENYSLILSAASQGYGVTYMWSVSGSGTKFGQNSSVSFNTPGVQTVTLTVSKCGCPDQTMTKNITVKPTPEANISGPSCGVTGSVYSFSSPSNSPLTGVSYSWTFGSGGSGLVTGGGLNADVSWSSEGAKNVCLEAEKDGCTDTDCHSIDLVSPGCPSAVFNLPDTVCQFENIGLSATDQGYGVTYSWTNSNGSPSASSGISNYVSFNSIGDQTVTLEVNKCECSADSDTKTIYVKEAPNASVTGTQFGYENTAYSFTAPSIPGATYTWSVDGSTVAGSTNVLSYSWSTIGYKNVCVTIMSANNCYEDACFTIGIIENTCPESVISGPTTACSGEEVVFEAQDEGCGVDYLWTINGQPSTGLSTSYTFGNPGTYDVQLIITTCGCNSCVADTSNLSITVNPGVTAVVTGPVTGFVNIPYVFTTPAQSNSTYSWTVQSSSATSTTNSITAQWAAAGSYEICATVTNTFSCSATDCWNIIIQDSSTVPGPNCIIDSVNFAELGLFTNLDNMTIVNSSTTTTFTQVDPQNVVEDQFTSTEYVRNGVLDTTSFWSQDPYQTSSTLCYAFGQPLDGVTFSVYDLDFHTGTDYDLQECFSIEAFDQGTPVSISPSEYSLGTFVSYDFASNSFCNISGDVPSNSDFGDVLFSLNNQVDSVCITFNVDGKDGLSIAPNGDIGISDIDHCEEASDKCTSGAMLEYSDLGYQVDLDGQSITGPQAVEVAFEKIDPNSVVVLQRTETIYDRGTLDSTGYWSQGNSATLAKSELCMVFNDRMKELEFSIYDLDFNNGTDFKLGERVTIKPMLNGSTVTLTAQDYTLGSYVVESAPNTFINKVGMVGSTDNYGDVNLHFSMEIDSVCVVFENEGKDGTLSVPDSDIGLSDFVFCAPITPVPVEWLSFEAKATSVASVLLEWSTASEENNEVFTVQRSQDGVEFLDIGYRDGAGNSREVSSYNFVDNTAPAGVNYYRIKQTDYNGEFDYTHVEIITLNGAEHLTVYPNPARGLATISLPKGSVSNQVLLTDISGNIIFEQNIQNKNATKVELDLTGLRSGLYFVKYGKYNTKLQIFN